MHWGPLHARRFYGKAHDNSGGLLPSYRTHPRVRALDLPGMRRSLEHILSWDFARALACHTDPIEGEPARALIRRAWAWVWSEGAPPSSTREGMP